MTLFNRDPHSCRDIDELQVWVAMLQELSATQKEISLLSREQSDLLRLANEQQGEQIAVLTERIEVLRERIEQYEVAFSVDHHNHMRRLN